MPSSLFLCSLLLLQLTSQQVRHRRGLDLSGRSPPERRGGLGELVADAQGGEPFDRRGRLCGGGRWRVVRSRKALEAAAARHDGY